MKGRWPLYLFALFIWVVALLWAIESLGEYGL